LSELMKAPELGSTRPYLIRALYEWCTDNGLTPYVAVQVDETVQVPREFVKNNEIVLNISFDATSSLKLGNEFIEFKARFGGIAREIVVPIGRVIAIYARENGQGMAFPSAPAAASGAAAAEPGAALVPVAPLAAPGKISPISPPPAAPEDDSDGDSKGDSAPPEPPKPPGRPALKRIK
jgi:stringent starvation protein B